MAIYLYLYCPNHTWCPRCLLVAAWLSGNALVSINVVALRRARLVLGWVNVRGYTILVFNQSHPQTLTSKFLKISINVPQHLTIISATAHSTSSKCRKKMLVVTIIYVVYIYTAYIQLCVQWEEKLTLMSVLTIMRSRQRSEMFATGRYSQPARRFSPLYNETHPVQSDAQFLSSQSSYVRTGAYEK